MLKSGQSATLAVVLTKKGKYEFLCTVPGHASAGMKGLLGIGVKVTSTSASASATSSGSAGGSVGSTGSGSTGGSSGGGGGTVPTSFPPGNAGNGLNVFNTAGCSGCHALAAAGSPQGDGPALDGTKLAVAAVEQQVVSGGGGMPPFGLQLTAQQIADVATFVSNSSQ
jgi:mono/diheme cytochrome c family protein